MGLSISTLPRSWANLTKTAKLPAVNVPAQTSADSALDGAPIQLRTPTNKNIPIKHRGRVSNLRVTPETWPNRRGQTLEIANLARWDMLKLLPILKRSSLQLLRLSTSSNSLPNQQRSPPKEAGEPTTTVSPFGSSSSARAARHEVTTRSAVHNTLARLQAPYPKAREETKCSTSSTRRLPNA